MPDLREYANDWFTLGLGVAMVLAGTTLRGWAIFSLGRYFRREVTIEPGQRIVRRGPYRVLRHPSYAGLFLVLAGFGLAFASWVGAAVALLVAFVGMLPRIRGEERRSRRPSARSTPVTRARRPACSRTSGSRICSTVSVRKPRRRTIVLASLLVEPILMWLRGYPIGGNIVVRCRQGHVFRTLWIPGVSLKALRLGWLRVQRCPVGHHWSVVTPVRESDLSARERRLANRRRDIRIP